LSKQLHELLAKQLPWLLQVAAEHSGIVQNEPEKPAEHDVQLLPDQNPVTGEL